MDIFHLFESTGIIGRIELYVTTFFKLSKFLFIFTTLLLNEDFR